MTNYIFQTCDCSGEVITNNSYIKGAPLQDLKMTNKIINNQVRYPSSLYANNIAAINVLEKCCDGTQKTSNNQSDRIGPAFQRKLNYSRRPKLRPGMLSPGGKNIDIKHNSYDRYLARKKAPHLLKNKTKFSSQLPQ